MAKKLCEDGFKADALNGNLNQNKRDRVMSDFRFKKFKVLVATDIASRGLDIDHIQHVINYDLPQVAEDYIHRIGRTGRAGSSGSTICFVSPEEQNIWDEIYYLLHPDTAKKPKKTNSRAVRKRSRESLRQKKPTRSFSKSNGPRRRNNSTAGKGLQKKTEGRKQKESNLKKHSKNTISRSTKSDSGKSRSNNKTSSRSASKKPFFSKAKRKSKLSRSNSR
jgi:superfamily II DNA/RNA helicase